MTTTRRAVLAAGAGAFALRGAPPERIVIGVIGAGGRGTLLMNLFQDDPGVRIGAICDVYEPNLENALASASKKSGDRPTAYRNYKALLENREITAVVIATPEHWHHRMLLDALAAGKDVYVEKPLCQTPEQGVELMAAEAKSHSVVQVGMQRRSYDLYLEGRKLVAAGTLGSVRMVRSWWLNNSLGDAEPPQLQGALDWDQWQGPARHKPRDPRRFFHWRLYSEYAGGIMADQGAHTFDGIHLLMDAGFPLWVTAAAGRPHQADGDTPESVVVTAEYPDDFLASFAINYAAMHYQTRNDQLTQLDGDRARMDVAREELKVYAQGAEEMPAVARASAKGFGAATTRHIANFLECVRTRQKPAAPVRKGFQAALIGQMANLSLTLGRRIRWNDQLGKIEV